MRATLGDRLRAERERRGIGLRQAAEETGVSFNTLSRIERGADCLHSHALAILRWLNADQDAVDVLRKIAARRPAHENAAAAFYRCREDARAALQSVASREAPEATTPEEKR